MINLRKGSSQIFENKLQLIRRNIITISEIFGNEFLFNYDKYNMDKYNSYNITIDNYELFYLEINKIYGRIIREFTEIISNYYPEYKNKFFEKLKFFENFLSKFENNIVIENIFESVLFLIKEFKQNTNNKIKNFTFIITILKEIDNYFFELEKNYDKTNNSEFVKENLDILIKKLNDLENKTVLKDKELNSERIEKDRLKKEIKIMRESYEKTLSDELELKKIEYENKLELEKLELKNIHERENLARNNRKEKIKKAIDTLKRPAKELRIEKIYNKKRRNYYTNISEIIFTITALIFALYIYFIYYHYFKINIIETLNFSIYLFSVFPIVFSTLIGFLFLRQANIKSNEIRDIDKRFILIHDINNSLLAITELKEDVNDKTEEIIDKLINNILNYDKTNKDNEDNYDFSELINSISKLNINIKEMNKN